MFALQEMVWNTVFGKECELNETTVIRVENLKVEWKHY